MLLGVNLCAMNLQSLVVVVVRLIALDFLLRVAVQLAPQLLSFTELYHGASLDEPWSLLVLPCVLVVGLVVSAVLFWVFALPIARLVTRGVPHDLSFGTLSLVDCYSVAFMGIGLFYIANHLPQILNWTHFLFKVAALRPGDTWKEEVKWYDVSQAFIPFIVGVVLFVNGRRWAAALARRDAATASLAAPASQKNEADV